MKRYALLIALIAAPASFAQVQVEVAVPQVRFEAAPPLVEVEPGIQVVPGHADEIFFVNGNYWMRRNGHWWRSRDWHGGWAQMHQRYVPPSIYRIPEGRYRNWRAEEHREIRHEERVIHEDRAREQAVRQDDRALRHEEHQEQREVRHEDHEIRHEEKVREREHE